MTVRRIWQFYCCTQSLASRPRRPGSRKFQEDHKSYIDFLVAETPSISLGDIKEKLETMCGLKASNL